VLGTGSGLIELYVPEGLAIGHQKIAEHKVTTVVS
jgi:hypothetical protein